MTNKEIKELLEWVVPPKILEILLKNLDRMIGFYKYDQKSFSGNSKIKNLEKNNRCFILGTGESTNKQDLTLLKNEISIGINGFFTHKDIQIISPKYYLVNSIFALHGDILEESRYIDWLKAMDETLNNKTIMFMDISDKFYIEKYMLFNNKTIYWYQQEYYFKAKIEKINLQRLEKGSSVSELAISVALHLGFESIYMLGIDHNWFNDGAYFDNERYNKYFKKDRATIIKECNLDAEYQMLGHAKIFNKYKKLFNIRQNIFNVNSDQDTYVDVFPKKIYEKLFE